VLLTSREPWVLICSGIIVNACTLCVLV
jgi:hypothetical protein